jgi:hypothetical protein
MLRHAIDSEILFRNVSIYIYVYIYVSFGHGSFLNVEGNYNRSMVPMLKHKGQNNSSKQSSVGNQKTSRMICGLRTGLILPKSHMRQFLCTHHLKFMLASSSAILALDASASAAVARFFHRSLFLRILVSSSGVQCWYPDGGSGRLTFPNGSSGHQFGWRHFESRSYSQQSIAQRACRSPVVAIMR